MSGLWTDEEKDELRRMRAAGIQAKIIARRMPGRNYRGVVSMIRQLALPRPHSGLGQYISLNITTDMEADMEVLRRVTCQSVSAFCRDALQRGMAEIAAEHRAIKAINHRPLAAATYEARA